MPGRAGAAPATPTMEAVVIAAARRVVAPVGRVRAPTVSPSTQASQRSAGPHKPGPTGAAPVPATNTFQLSRASSSSKEEHSGRIREVGGSNPPRPTVRWRVGELVTRLALTQEIGGSSPPAPAARE